MTTQYIPEVELVDDIIRFDPNFHNKTEIQDDVNSKLCEIITEQRKNYGNDVINYGNDNVKNYGKDDVKNNFCSNGKDLETMGEIVLERRKRKRSEDLAEEKEEGKGEKKKRKEMKIGLEEYLVKNAGGVETVLKEYKKLVKFRGGGNEVDLNEMGLDSALKLVSKEKELFILLLKKLKWFDLNKIIHKYFDTDRYIKSLKQKFKVIVSIADYKFDNGICRFAKREMEVDYIRRKLENDNLTEMFSAQEVPSELLLLIFSFLEKNLDFLNNIGCVSEAFYSCALMSFGRDIPLLSLTARRINSIPVLVLQNLRRASIFVDRLLYVNDIRKFADYFSREGKLLKVFGHVEKFFSVVEGTEYVFGNLNELSLENRSGEFTNELFLSSKKFPKLKNLSLMSMFGDFTKIVKKENSVFYKSFESLEFCLSKQHPYSNGTRKENDDQKENCFLPSWLGSVEVRIIKLGIVRNGLAKVLKQNGALLRTVDTLCYLSDFKTSKTEVSNIIPLFKNVKGIAVTIRGDSTFLANNTDMFECISNVYGLRALKLNFECSVGQRDPLTMRNLRESGIASIWTRLILPISEMAHRDGSLLKTLSLVYQNDFVETNKMYYPPLKDLSPLGDIFLVKPLLEELVQRPGQEKRSKVSYSFQHKTSFSKTSSKKCN